MWELPTRVVLDHFLLSQSFLFSDVFSFERSKTVSQTNIQIVILPVTTT